MKRDFNLPGVRGRIRLFMISLPSLLLLLLCAQAGSFKVSGVDPAPGSTTSGSPSSITLTFTAAVHPASVTTSVFQVVGRGVDGVFGTPDDLIVSPTSILVSGNVITISFAGQTLPDDVYRITVSGTATPPAPASGLYGRWSMDEGSANLVADSSGNGRNGTRNGSNWIPGMFGSALNFSGGNSRVDIDAGFLSPPWTTALWLRRVDSTQIDARIMDCAPGANTTSLRMEQFNPANRVGYTQYGVADYAFNYIAPEGVWTHLTWVGTPTATSLYVNGAFFETIGVPIDLYVYKLGSAGGYAMTGDLDEVQVYSQALSAGQISGLAGLGGCLRSTTGEALDGEFSVVIPTGDGVSGGDFVSTFTVGPSSAAGSTNIFVNGCGSTGLEVLLVLALRWSRRRRRIDEEVLPRA
jgi:hypothetical protein